MSRYISTYQHDYINPKKMLADTLAAQQRCFGRGAADKQTAPIPKAPDASPQETEWTGISPMGKLLDPRLIPCTAGVAAFQECPQPMQPIVCPPCKPKEPPPSCSDKYYNSNPKRACDGLFESTYRADYVHPKDAVTGLRGVDGCAEKEGEDWRTRYERCGYQPPLRTGVCCKHCPVTWLPQKGIVCGKPPVTEYQAILSKTGELVMNLRLLDHRKCKGACSHPIDILDLPIKVK